MKTLKNLLLTFALLASAGWILTTIWTSSLNRLILHNKRYEEYRTFVPALYRQQSLRGIEMKVAPPRSYLYIPGPRQAEIDLLHLKMEQEKRENEWKEKWGLDQIPPLSENLNYFFQRLDQLKTRESESDDNDKGWDYLEYYYGPVEPLQEMENLEGFTIPPETEDGILLIPATEETVFPLYEFPDGITVDDLFIV